MSVETNINFIADLNDTFPRKNDLIKEGDDHIRLIKRVVKNTVPGFNKAVSITADKLNLLDTALTIDGQSITTNTSLKIGTGKGFNANGNRVTNVGVPSNDTDAVTLKYLRDIINNITWPVGSLYFSTEGINPASKFGFGTWVSFGGGRVLVGSGSSTDSNGLQQNFSLNGLGGEYTHAIKPNELPAHTHDLSLTMGTAGAHSHTFEFLQIAKPSPDTKHNSNIAQNGMTTYTTSVAGDHTHPISGTVTGGGAQGAGAPFTNMQPFVVVSIWKRTA